MSQLIDGKSIAGKIRHELKVEVTDFIAQNNQAPGLATILVGENAASKVYIRNKINACKETGIVSQHHNLAESTTQETLLKLIHTLNADPSVHGILVQLPLPNSINSQDILEAIAPHKDVDGFHPINLGHLLIGQDGLKPCTPFGIMKLLEEIGVDPAGLNAVVIGRSNIVGKPIALMLLQANATVTICHSKTRDLASVVKTADIIVAAVGIAHFVKGSWVKPGAVVIDVGINRLDDSRLVGDVDFEAAKSQASYITPVPGGVGPMTIAMLLWNTLKAAKAQNKTK